MIAFIDRYETTDIKIRFLNSPLLIRELLEGGHNAVDVQKDFGPKSRVNVKRNFFQQKLNLETIQVLKEF